MKKTPGGFSPVMGVDRKAAQPLHRQIYDAHRALIAGARLAARPADSVHTGSHGGVGNIRIPVLTAHAQLLAEGYFESRVGADGTCFGCTLRARLSWSWRRASQSI